MNQLDEAMDTSRMRTRVWRRGIAILALALGVTLVVVADSGTIAKADSPDKHDVRHIGNPIVLPLTSVQLENDRRFRLTFGFRSDDGYIAHLYASAGNGGLPGANRNWAALLTAEEAADMSRRQELAELVGPNPLDASVSRLTPFGRFLKAHVADFGGQYFDQRADGAIVVLVTTDVHSYETQLAAILGARADHLRVVRVGHTYAELNAISQRVARDINWLVDHGVAVSSFGPDVVANAVVIRVPVVTDSITAAVTTRYVGAPVQVAAGPSFRTMGSSDTQAPPMMGGLLMWRCADNAFACSSATSCSAAFIINSGGSSPTYAILSAGHCGSGTWLQGSPYTLGDYTVGTTATAYFDSGGDAEVIPLTVQADGSHSPFVYISTTSCGFNCTSHNLRIISGYEQATNVGEVTCESRSNQQEQDEVCGSVTQSQQCVTEEPSNLLICHQIFADFPSMFGDSGGPFYQPQAGGYSTAQGVTSSSDLQTLTTYTQIVDALAAISNAGGGTWSIY